MDENLEAQEASRAVVHAEKNAAQARENARTIQISELSDKVVSKAELAEIMREQIMDVLAQGTEHEKSIILARVPYICQDIKGIFKTLEEMNTNMVNQDQFWPVKTLVYGLVAIMLTGVMGAILVLIIK